MIQTRELPCLYGNHGPVRTWCRSDQVRGDAASRSVPNALCDACPHYVAAVTGARAPRRTERPVEKQFCVHLLPVIENVDCDVCGGRQRQFPIHGCALHGQCATAPYVWEMLRENQRKVKSCAACPNHEGKLS